MVNELITVIEKDNQQTVSARELHEKLGIATAFKDWFPRMCEYGFEDGKDFSSFLSESNGGRPSKEYSITVEMAKQICMLQRSEKGKQYREYFLKLERAWNSPEMVMQRAIQIANKQVEEMKRRLFEVQPLVDFAVAVTDSTDCIDIGETAKVLNCGIGRNKLFDFLRNKGVLRQNNQPYQKFIDCGYFRVIEQKYPQFGTTKIRIKTIVYQKGVDFIRKLVNANMASIAS